MTGYRRRNIWWYALCMVLLAASCGSPAVRTRQPAAQATSETPARASQAGAGAWLSWLQMTSASTGWALRSTVSPWSTEGGYLATARTTDGARTWTDVTPPAALLKTPDATAVLDALGPDRAWLAVTAAARTHSSSPLLTVVFGTSNGGRTWTGFGAVQGPCPGQPAQLRRSRRRLAAGQLRRHDGTRPGLAVPDHRRRTALVAARGDPAVRDRPQWPARRVRQGGAGLRHRAGRLAGQRVQRRVAGCTPSHPGRRRAVDAAGAAGPGQRLLLLRLRGVQPPAVLRADRVRGHRGRAWRTRFPGQPRSRQDLAARAAACGGRCTRGSRSSARGTA